MILSLLMAMLFAPIPCLDPGQDRDPIVSTSIEVETGGLLAVHMSGALSLSLYLDEAGVIITSRSVGAASNQTAAIDNPELITKWTDAQNVDYEVHTPIPSTTPSGLAAAVALHEKLVQIMQAVHPPKPIPPTTP